MRRLVVTPSRTCPDGRIVVADPATVTGSAPREDGELVVVCSWRDESRVRRAAELVAAGRAEWRDALEVAGTVTAGAGL